MTKAIFLDIDGVICCNMVGRLEDAKMAQLRRVVEATGAKIVLSTDWRRQLQLKRQVIAACKRFDMEVIGATPQRPMYTPVRPMEIMDWMNANGNKEQISAWVAIDDRDLVNEIGGSPLNGHFIRTHPATGLTTGLADSAIQLLGMGDAMTLSGQPGAVATSEGFGIGVGACSPMRTPTRSPVPAGGPVSPLLGRRPFANDSRSVGRPSFGTNCNGKVGCISSPPLASTHGTRMSERQAFPSPPRSFTASLAAGVAGTSPPTSTRRAPVRAGVHANTAILRGFGPSPTPAAANLAGRGRGPTR